MKFTRKVSSVKLPSKRPVPIRHTNRAVRDQRPTHKGIR